MSLVTEFLFVFMDLNYVSFRTLYDESSFGYWYRIATPFCHDHVSAANDAGTLKRSSLLSHYLLQA